MKHAERDGGTAPAPRRGDVASGTRARLAGISGLARASSLPLMLGSALVLGLPSQAHEDKHAEETRDPS
jgi:hypothetical protein